MIYSGKYDIIDLEEFPMKETYIPRLFDKTLEFALRSKGAVLVVGPKWCGKSTTSARQAKTIIDLTIEETKSQYVAFAKASPTLFLQQGERPLMIDEWQEISFIWNSIKDQVDKSRSFGQFILTGSVSEKEKVKRGERHTGTGRIVRKMMRPMSLFESHDSNGGVSLKSLSEGEFKPCFCSVSITDYAFFICRGGWPMAIGQEEDVALQQAKDFYDATVNEDIFSLKDIALKKDVARAKKLLRSYARNVSSECPDSLFLADVSASEGSFNERTLGKYLLALQRLYVTEELEAWNPNLRSKIAIRSKPTRHFVDPSIASSALGVTPKSLFKDMRTFGFLFESLCVRDLRIYCDSIGAKLYHYRDKAGREADAVIEYPDGSYALVEVKMGDQGDIDKAARKLLALSGDIDEEKTGKPAFLMIITMGVAALRREDGVYEIPLACLKD